MSQDVTRRDFIKQGGAAAAIAAGGSLLTGCQTLAGKHVASEAPAIGAAGVAPSGRINVALIGCGGRGTNVVEDMMAFPEVRVIAICDPDQRRMDDFAKKVEKKYGQAPQMDKDYRKILENKDLTACMVATPDHWHCLPNVHACEVGLDVYQEKPISHSIAEGRAMVNAARKYNRVVQVGTQQRSAKHFKEAVDFVHSGALGQITLVKTWNWDYDMPNALGPGNSDCPKEVDYDLWLGPAPKTPFNSNRFHYQWRWFFDYAGGMLCDWGIHLLDIAQWGMKAEAPEWIQASGGLYALPDNRTTPDTIETCFRFGPTEIAPKGFLMTYSNSKACGRGTNTRGYGIEFHGVNGTLFVDRSNVEIIGHVQGKTRMMENKKFGGSTDNDPHIKNWLDCIKSRERPISDIEIGHRSTSTPQLANIAYLTGERLHWDAKAERFLNSKEGNKMLGRKYRAPWDKEARHLPVDSEMRSLLV